MADPKSETASRREFLTLAGGATLGGVAAVATPEKSAAAKTDQTAQRSGYRETAHVRTFYELAGF